MVPDGFPAKGRERREKKGKGFFFRKNLFDKLFDVAIVEWRVVEALQPLTSAILHYHVSGFWHWPLNAPLNIPQDINGLSRLSHKYLFNINEPKPPSQNASPSLRRHLERPPPPPTHTHNHTSLRRVIILNSILFPLYHPPAPYLSPFHCYPRDRKSFLCYFILFGVCVCVCVRACACVSRLLVLEDTLELCSQGLQRTTVK